jgi:PAS domain S-box-containing protein
LTPDLTIVAVSEAYLQTTMTKHDEILGRHLFEVFPDNPDDPSATGVSNLRASLNRVLQHRAPDTMAVQKYDIRRTESEGDGFEERYWSPVNSPVLGTNGEVAYIIHRVVDVTEFIRLKQAGSEQGQITETLRTRVGEMEAEIFRRAQQIQEINNQLRTDLAARRKAEEALQEAAAEHQGAEEERDRFFTLSLDLLCIAGFDGYFKRLNPAWERVLGYTIEELLTEPYLNFIHPDDRDTTGVEVKKNEAGSQTISLENRYRCKDGSYRWLLWSATPSREQQLIYASARDITEYKRAEAAMREALATLDAAVDGAFIFDPQTLRFSYVNEGAVRQVGYSREELLRMTPLDIKPEFDEPRFRAVVAPLVSGAEMAHSFTTVHRRKDGVDVPVEINLQCVGAGTAQARMIAIVRDITERKRAEEKFRRVVEGAPNAIILVNQKGTIALVNAQAEILFGYSREELRGQSIETLVPARFRGAHPGHRAAFSADPTARPMGAGRDLYGLHKDGREIPIEIGLNPIETKDGHMILSSIIDISERKRAEEEICRRGQLIEAANKELESFSYSVSHDLRAPLRSIDGFSQALLEDCAGLLNEQGKDHLNRIRAASQRMGQLIDDLLDLAHTARHEVRHEPVDLSALALGVADEVRKIWPGRQVELVVAPGLRAQGDPGLLRIVFDNLLGNAWKFTSKQERATIEVGALSHDGTTAYFVRDNGAGFDMAYADKLFGAFQRLHAMTEYPGTGIGLATVQRIVARHGGLVWAEGQVGQGATFYFTLGERSAQ